METSRTLVYQTLEFAAPRRIPRDVWLLPWAWMNYPQQTQALIERFPSDFVTAPAPGRVAHVQGDAYEVGTFIDEWGCIFTGNQRGVIGEVKDAAISTWDDLPNLRVPEGMLHFDAAAVNAFCQTTDQFVMGGCCPRPFERLQFLRGSAQLYLDLGEQSAQMMELLHTVHEFYLKELEAWAKTDVDGLMFMDDWGAQNRLLIAPRMWRKLFKPLYKDYIDLAHAYGKKIFMHSDGYTLDIFADLVELGLDALNSQLFCMDIEEIGRKFKGKMTFWGEIDRQNLLPFGTPAQVADAVSRVAAALYAQGGVIAQCEFSAGSQPQNVMQVYQSWEEVIRAE